jgi:hypothetical protein
MSENNTNEQTITEVIHNITNVHSHLILVNTFAEQNENTIDNAVLKDITDTLISKVDEALNELHHL